MTVQKIPFSAAQSEFTEKRSRFIGQVWPGLLRGGGSEAHPLR